MTPSTSRAPEGAPLDRGLGALPQPQGGTTFTVWAPEAKRVRIRLYEPERDVELESTEHGHHTAFAPDVEGGTRYMVLLDDGPPLPDPASRCQPQGVWGPSEVVARTFPWTDQAWRGRRLEELVFYEVHVGTCTTAGTFDALIQRLDALVDLGVTALQLMPVAQFPGARNWGYDGVFPWAAQNTYGGPDGLRRLVDAAHTRGLAVFLDVVYNHLGPEGNVLGRFGPYFTDRYRTPWGDAINFDGAHSDEVRRYFIENALWWLGDCHLDGLRLDAVHAILDRSARPFLQELAERVHALAQESGRTLHVVAESDANDPTLVEAPRLGGYGLDAQWSDDLHHAVHALLTGEESGYYEDFGGIEHLERALRTGYSYTGQRSPHRQRRHGRVPRSVPPSRFVVYGQNHDQVGNRARGDRLIQLTDLEGVKLAAATILLSPFLPLLFMGEEWGETHPFPYFVDHSDPALVEAVREGRAREFSGFRWAGEIPDPAAQETFESARIVPERAQDEPHRTLLTLYRSLLALRSARWSHGARADTEPPDVARVGTDTIALRNRSGRHPTLLLLHFGRDDAAVPVALPNGSWRRRLDTAAERWRGPGTRSPERLKGEMQVDLRRRSAVFYIGEDS